MWCINEGFNDIERKWNVYECSFIIIWFGMIFYFVFYFKFLVICVDFQFFRKNDIGVSVDFEF